MKSILTIAILLSSFAVMAQTNQKRAKTTAHAPVATNVGIHTITITLPDAAMNYLLGSAGYGFDQYILTTSPQPGKPIGEYLQATKDYYIKTVFPAALQQFKHQLKAEADSVGKATASADSVKNLKPRNK